MEGTSENVAEPSLDLIGGPFAVIESDPGVFSSLIRGFGVQRTEVVEIYDIEQIEDCFGHCLDPYGLIFCFTWHKDTHRPTDFDDPAAEHVWFANQLSDDACATHAILNVLLNCPGLDLGNELGDFRRQTQEFSPVMKGLAVTNSPLLRRVHNSLARPADLRMSLSSAAEDVVKKTKTNSRNAEKQRKSETKKSDKAKEKAKADDESENSTYHFIGYVPAFGKVWELDGLKSGPLEVGEMSSDSSRSWMEVARPALRLKMAKYGGSGLEDSNIRFSLLAITQDILSILTDELEFLRKDKEKLEGLLETGWEAMVVPELYQQSMVAFECASQPGYEHPPGFAGRRMERDVELAQMTQSTLLSTWKTVVENGVATKTKFVDELARRTQAESEHLKRTFDYEPFFKQFITELHNQGLLNPLLGLDDNGRKMKRVPPTKRRRP